MGSTTKKIRLPEIGAVMVLVARRWINRPTEYTAASALQTRVDDCGGQWSINQIEKIKDGDLVPGFRLTHEQHDFAHKQAAGQKGRLESELVLLARHHNGLKRQIAERKRDIENLKIEAGDITRLIEGQEAKAKQSRAEVVTDENLQNKLAVNAKRQDDMRNALAYWENELATYQPAVDSLNAQIQQQEQIMAKRTVETWEFLNCERLEIDIVD